MKVLSRILDKLNVLNVRFEPDGELATAFVPYAFVKGKLTAGEQKPVEDLGTVKETLSKAPLIVAVSGRGVITKEAAAGGIAATVTADPETFLWTVSGGRISFVRREQLAAVTDELEKHGIGFLYTDCLPDEEETSLTGVAERFYAERLKWKHILKPSPEGSSLALLVAKRLQLPVFGVLMLLLIANFMVSSRVGENFQAAGAELAALRKSSSAAETSSGRRQAAIEQFSARLPFRFAMLADRIAAAVPDKVILNELSIAPLTKNMEAGKPIQQRERTVIISGETPASESVMAFVESLAGLKAGTVRLASVEQNKEKAVLTFKIEMEL